ncbi:GTP-binding protein Era [Coccomyxa subellipsoidea C-169]|uniref:GTP-binding protein Era n=1 Tax=Coccomyxa subellipsoidea (strain C-169) TaxID=574566 RepID=I0YYT6_COCSC|nr:GTP-binding protein Era [Coccomyxa subellipsoidea C-169]EIE23555.1 GTP-binding protein Era [Coccomyxa subellipsoidea C-169]|eukprot:XP_005648099.1 GTP-binding protein Era [Coccomyxa subellipsoidea C-169]
MSRYSALLRHLSNRSALRFGPILRLLPQERAAAEHTSAIPHSQNGDNSGQTENAGEEMSSSSDVSRLLSGLRERLSAFERAHADAVSQNQSADATGNGTQAASPEAGPYAPASEQDFWAAPRQLYSAAAELEEFEAAEEDAEEEEVPDPSHFDASELGDSAEARRLLSILCAPHQAAADEAAGPRYVASQDSDIPDAAADIEWRVQQTRVRSHDVSTESTEDIEPLDDMLQADQFEAADEDARAETVPINDQRLLQAGIVGVPNSGKSTLTNALVGHKVSAVSSKTNTTDATRLGAFTEGPAQVALYDTPGVVTTRFLRGNQHAKRVRSAWGTASDCEMLLFIVDAHRQITEPDERVLQLVEELAAGPLPSWDPPPALLLLNKIDRLSKEERPHLSRLGEHLNSIYPFQDTFSISAKHGVGMTALRQYLLSRSSPGKWALEAGESTDMTLNDIAREVLKEKVFRRLYKEIPYEVQIEDVSFKMLMDGSLRIEKNLMVRSDQVRRIVVGKKGAAIGEIGASARKELEIMLKKRVHLMLYVKITKKNHA